MPNDFALALKLCPGQPDLEIKTSVCSDFHYIRGKSLRELEIEAWSKTI